MKKISILLLLVLVCSCSKSDDSSITNSKSINPPTWIQGRWLLEDVPVNSGFKFTTNDFCLDYAGMYVCNKEAINLYNGTQIFTDVKEEITNSTYSIEITIGSNTTYYKFEKVSSTSIRGIQGTISAIYVKQ